MITRLLVANRAEIASRVFRTCRELGIETVAVHSDPDAHLPYVREADLAVRLPGSTPAETYLRVDLLLDAARRSGADAVHPGYGFLSENAGFARAVLDAGLTWVGPDPGSIEAMGSKIRAKAIMREAGVPVLEAPDQPTEADLPLLVKASAGGGGRGMRVVRSLADLDAEVARARAEAESAFGDGTVFVEPYVERGRHVEVQVVGTSVYGDRDCSVQRRHQKVVEEAPAPGLSDEVRAAMHQAARKAAEAIDYRGAGTVEFLYDPATGRFWFLEMNTRLQVEHPVTELVHGVDLVAMQLAAAEVATRAGFETGAARLPQPAEGLAGGPAGGLGFETGAARLPQPAGGPGFGTGAARLPQPAEGAGFETGAARLPRPAAGGPAGHAIEVRLYAEDPAADYQPQSGVLTTFEVPEAPGIRVDAGFESGSEVSTHYDAMLAKVVAHAPTRAEAARRLAGVLSRARIHGLVTNRDLLVEVLRSPEFLAGDVSTAFLAGRTSGRRAADAGAPVAAALALAERAGAARTVQRGIPVAWRNVVSQPQRTELEHRDGTVTTVEWSGTRDGYVVDGYDVVAARPERVTLERDGVRSTYAVSVAGGAVDVDGPGGHVRMTRVPRFVDPAEQLASGSLVAPMPGTVVRVAVEKGAQVAAGQPVLVLEAMKMQHTVTAPTAGTVTELRTDAGQQVAAGEVLAVVEEEQP